MLQIYNLFLNDKRIYGKNVFYTRLLEQLNNDGLLLFIFQKLGLDIFLDIIRGHIIHGH